MVQSSVERLLVQLSQGKPIHGVLLLGRDTFLRDLCRKKLIDALVDEATRDWAVSRFSAKEDSADAVLGQAQTLPMLAPRQVVFWSDLEALERLGEDSRKAVVTRLEEYLQDPAPFTTLVLEAENLDARMNLFKLLSEKMLVVGCELPGELEGRVELAAAMTEQMAGGLQLEIDGDAAQELAERTNAGLARMQSEMEKLAAFVGDRRKITRADVEALVVPDQRYTVWQLSEMLASGKRDKAMVFLENLLREGEQAVGVLGAIAWMYRKLIEVQDLRPGAQVFDAVRLGMRKETAELALKYAPRIPRKQLLRGLADLAEADSRLKSGVASPGAVMEFLVARLTSRPDAAVTAKI
jgi:DNA polymerase III subunit delta